MLTRQKNPAISGRALRSADRQSGDKQDGAEKCRQRDSLRQRAAEAARPS